MVCALLVASEATPASKQPRKSNINLRIEHSDVNYQHIHVHIVYMVLVLMVASEATTASDLKSDLRIDISDPKYICCHAYLAPN